jgi:hypothetical protein
MVDLSKIDSVKLPVKPMLNLLTEDDRVLLEQVMARLPAIEDAIHRAAQCGIDVSAQADRHNMHATIAPTMHAKQFPRELPAIQE